MKHITKARTTKSAGMRSCAPKELALCPIYCDSQKVTIPENMERFIRLYWKHACKQTILVSSFLSDKNNCKCRYTLIFMQNLKVYFICNTPYN